jgi:hypothetical protein
VEGAGLVSVADDRSSLWVDLIAHGTHSAYVHLDCRCEHCRQGEAAYQRDYRARNRDRLNAYDRQPERDTRLRDDPMRRKVRGWTYDKLRRRKPHPACETCGSPKAQAHHDDYERPLNVRWLCTVCHGMEHRRPNTARECGLL